MKKTEVLVVDMKTKEKIKHTMDEIRDFLIQKNEQYGDSVMNPIRVFSKAGIDEGLRIRIDDKDVVKDLIGYLTLLLIQIREE